MAAESEVERVIAGFRPTRDLTVGNYFGAIKPALEIQADPTKELYFFGADLHALTDHEPREVSEYRTEVVLDLLAAGVDPVGTSTSLYMQTDIESQVTQIANRVSPYIGVGRLARTPNLKEKVQPALRGEVGPDAVAFQANFSLLGYPVLMAADIYAQSASLVSVGEDQIPHLEIARDIAASFNKEFDTSVLVYPTILAVDSLRVMSLDGKGKMSKTNPKGAIILTDEPEAARAKINKAATASAGEWNDVIESHFDLALNMTSDPDKIAEIEDIRTAHLKGTMAMGAFKQIWGDVTETFLDEFQKRKAAITQHDVDLARSVSIGKVTENADSVLANIKEAMTF